METDMTYTEHFRKIVEDQLAKVEKLKNSPPVPDFAAMDKIVIGTIDGSVLFLNNCLNEDTAWVCATAMTPEMYGYYFLDTLCKTAMSSGTPIWR